MEIVLFYADWCPHCHELLKNEETLKKIIQDNGFKYKKVENSETEENNRYKSKYSFEPQYFPTLIFFDGNKDFEELTVEFIGLKKQLKKLKEKYKKEDFTPETKKQDKKQDRLIIICQHEEYEKIAKLCEKLKYLAAKNNIKCSVYDKEEVKKIKGIDKFKTPLFLFIDLSANKTTVYKYTKQDLKNLYSFIVDRNNYFGVDYIPEFISNLFKSFTDSTLFDNYNKQLEVNDSTIIKCKSVGNERFCQTIQ